MPRRRLAAPVLLLASLVALAGAPPAEATRDVPDGTGRAAATSVTIAGRGYGHGRGLSQYGALGRAKAGQGYGEIARHYYPGTRWGTAAGPVKVLITGDTTNDLLVTPRSALTVRSLGAGRTWTLPARRDGHPVKRWRVTPASGHRSTVSYRTAAWHPWRTVAGDAQFAAGGAPIRLSTPGGSVQYRGTLRSVSVPHTARARDTVNILPLDAYLRGVVPREVPALWPAAAGRAQAVAARTYAAYERAHRSGRFNLYDTTQSQVYGGYSAEHPASDGAVRVTARRVLLSGGAPAFTQFSASNGGYSVAGGFPYLRAARDTFDRYDPDGDGTVGWRVRFTGDQITRHWKGLGSLRSITVNTRDGKGPYGGRVLKLTVTGDKGRVSGVDGSAFASYLGLRSTLFTVSVAR